jgi:hypothetical protein
MLKAAMLTSPPRTWWQQLLWLGGCVAFFAAVYYAHQFFLPDNPDPIPETGDEWKFADLELARENIPPDENSAVIVQRVAGGLPPDWPPPPIMPPPNRQYFWYLCRPYALRDEGALAEELNRFRFALRRADKLADMPRGRYALKGLDKPWSILLPHLRQVEQVEYLLRLDTLQRGNSGDLKGAARSSVAALNTARSIGDEPTVLSQLLRTQQVVLASRGMQFVVNHGELDTDTLADLQARLEDEARHPGFLIAMRGNRAVANAMLNAIEQGSLPWAAVLAPVGSGPHPGWMLAPGPDEIRGRHEELTPFLTRVVDIADEPPPRRAAKVKDFIHELDPDTFEMMGSLVSHLPGTEERFASGDAMLRCGAAALAAERYRCEHGNWPKSLADLKPAYLADVPLDPADGEPMRYHHFDDGIAVYSLCLDERGRKYVPVDPNAPPEQQVPPHWGVGVRLWDVKERGRKAPPLAEPPGFPPPPPLPPREGRR